MHDLVDRLARLNRKERYWLVRDAIGAQPLSADFRQRLGRALSRPYSLVLVPENAWWATDYHFDWLRSALGLPAGPDGLTITDLDMVVAFERTLILVEAKCDSAWTNEQITRKIKRLTELGVSGQGRTGPLGVQVFFALASPLWRRPQRLDLPGEWRIEGALPWVRMMAPEPIAAV